MSKEISLLERMAVSTNRKLEYYLSKTEMDVEDLRNKKILNVGAGRTNLQRDLEMQGIRDAQVANIDLAYDPTRIKKWTGGRKISQEETPHNAIGADFKRIPFVDDSFDIAIASWSVSPWIENKKVQLFVFKEMLRVAKDVYVIPFNKLDYKGVFGNLSSPQEYHAELLEGKMKGETTLHIARHPQ